MTVSFTFPNRYETFHEDRSFNFQLNRFYSMGLVDYAGIKEAGEKIQSRDDWKAEMHRLAEKAVAEGRLLNAAFYYRSAEFYLFQDNPDKQLFYERFLRYFNEALQDEGIEYSDVPYGSGYLPVMRLTHTGNTCKGTIVIHGGNDSFIQEFYPFIRCFADAGYDVIGFDGPGQGGALKKYGLVLDTAWEKPVKAVLDHFNLDDVTLIGISMGGWLCLRAAAFESRIKRVVPWSVSYDVTRYTNPVGRMMAGFLMKHLRNFVNSQMKKNINKSMEYSWFVNNLMYITGRRSPIEAFDVLMQFTSENLHSDRIRQDVLILTGREDHLVPYKMHDMQVKALTNAHSVTPRVFTREEQAQNHCQMGNLQLALNVIADWLESVR